MSEEIICEECECSVDKHIDYVPNYPNGCTATRAEVILMHQLKQITAERDQAELHWGQLAKENDALTAERDALAKQLEVARKAMQQTVNNAPIEHHFQAIKRAKDTLAEIEKEE
jgi:cell division protein FtsL